MSSHSFTTTEERTVFCFLCPDCGLLMGVDQAYIELRRDDGSAFYCPNGHIVSYRGQSWKEKAAKAQQQAASAQDDARIARIERDEARKALRKTKRDQAAGKCPYCNRNFVQMQRHIHSKHPDKAHEGER